MERLPEGPLWARAQRPVHGLRRGAWYRVARASATSVVLQVNRATVRVPRSAVDILTTPPHRWSIVPRPPAAVRCPPDWGDRYAICPACRTRAQIKGHPLSLRCPRCGGGFPIAWGEVAPRAAAGALPSLGTVRPIADSSGGTAL